MPRKPTCTVAMEACANSHYWGARSGDWACGATLCAYVKPFVKRQKDAADVEAICEAAARPTVRFVAVKSEEQQAAIVFRTGDLLVRQRTQPSMRSAAI